MSGTCKLMKETSITVTFRHNGLNILDKSGSSSCCGPAFYTWESCWDFHTIKSSKQTPTVQGIVSHLGDILRK